MRRHPVICQDISSRYRPVTWCDRTTVDVVTVIDRFANWQHSPLDWTKPPYEACSPNLDTIETYLVDRWGGMSLGCHANRPVRSGGSVSSHSYGAALDWRYEDPGPGRDLMLSEVLPWILDNSDELGVQAVHDYYGSRIWRPPGHSGRPVAPSPECGWRKQSPSGNMGGAWASTLR